MASPPSAEKACSTREHTWLTSNMEFNNLRKQGALCDVTLVVQGKCFPAHRVVLAAASTASRLMFTTKMMEEASPEVELRSVEPDTIELLLEYIYTSQITVDMNNVQSLLNVANQYQIEPVRTICVKFINGQIDATNCLGIAALADCMNCPELKMAAEEFAQLHFVDVCRLDEFLQLDIAQLTHLLRQDKLCVCSETQVYDAAVRWLKYNISNRRSHVAEVLRCVRLSLVSKTYLLEAIMRELLFIFNPECRQMITRVMCRSLQSQEEPRCKKHHYCIALFKGPHCCYFDPRDSSWTSIRCLFEERQNTTAVSWNGVVYILGASALDLFESYNTVKESWQVNTSMLVSRCSHGSVVANGLIYVCGGMAGTSVSGRILRNCEVYNPNTQQWRKLHEMRVARKNHGLVVVNNGIYAVGGEGSTGALDSVEYYDIARNKWHAAARMP